jgi:aspartate/methionine/tyrosine aminotransferase
MLNALGEAAGAGFGIVTGVARGYEKMKKGDVYEGIEAMTPAFIRNPMKAGRYATEGALTARGDPIIEDITTGEVIGQMFGFSPQRLSSQYKINNQIKDIEQAVLKRRNSLMDSYAKAVREKDRDTQNEIRDEIREFNKANPGKGLAITQETIRRSLKKRESISKETEKGIFITKGVRPRISEYKDVEEPQ